MVDYPFLPCETGGADGNIQILRLTPKGFTHQHKYFELVYVLRGKATRKLSDAMVPVSAGDYYVANPRSAHGYENLQNLEVIHCLFLPEHINQALEDCPSISSLLSNRILRFGVPMDIPIADRVLHDVDGSVRRIIKSMEREYAEHRTGYMEMLRCYLTQVLVYAVRASETSFPHEAVTKIMEHLKSHYSKALSLEELSRLVDYTPQYLSSLFSNEVGMSIQEFLQRLRVEEACKLLTNTTLSMAEIAAAVGYQDTRHFSKIFRRYQTISPKEYRKTTETPK